MVQVRILVAERTAAQIAGVCPARTPWGWGSLHEDTVDEQGESLPVLGEVSDAWLVGRARELIALAQRTQLEGQLSAAVEVDRLLAESQRRGEPRMVAQVLRAAAVVRLVTASLNELAEPLLHELLVHSSRHGLVVLESDAHALLGRLALMRGRDDTALSEVATALAMLDEDLAPDILLGRRNWERLVSQTLLDIGLVLTQLGIYEQADHVLARAHQCIRTGGGPHEISVHLINRVRLLIGWGLRLERVGKHEEAVERFGTASAIAVAVEAPWRESLFPRRDDRPAATQDPMLGAAHALARPNTEHVEQLTELLARALYPRELIISAIGLARCLEKADRVREAVEVLSSVRKQLEHDTSEPTLRLSLVREYARLSGPDGGRDADTALADYASALETELWSMRESRIAALYTHLEHERLSREHGAIAQQALQDPLTGLPNRRALDERLDHLIRSPGSQPLAIALVDLDGFKGVNDRCSHAEGDDVLRVVASTLRDALRGDDLVARYGGDEFVVLLPGAPLAAAEAALRRAVDAVAGLPNDLSRGVRLSIGVVAVSTGEGAGQALARADAAMYQAKRQGGNRVATSSGTEPSLDLSSGSVWAPPSAP